MRILSCGRENAARVLFIGEGTQFVNERGSLAGRLSSWTRSGMDADAALAQNSGTGKTPVSMGVVRNQRASR